jgi:hypothetical protein
MLPTLFQKSATKSTNGISVSITHDIIGGAAKGRITDARGCDPLFKKDKSKTEKFGLHPEFYFIMDPTWISYHKAASHFKNIISNKRLPNFRWPSKGWIGCCKGEFSVWRWNQQMEDLFGKDLGIMKDKCWHERNWAE